MGSIAVPQALKIESIQELIGIAVSLGADEIQGWTPAEEAFVASATFPAASVLSNVRRLILKGHDPLGDAFCRILSAEERRPTGATYTPAEIVKAMLGWAADQLQPARVVDPGAGSGRFLVAAGRLFPYAELIAVEQNPVAATLARAHLAAAGLADRTKVIVDDYRKVVLPIIDGRTLYAGNPPYVRHHLIEQKWKSWLVQAARKHGLEASQLAGLHVHFFLATAEHAVPGDVGIFVTAAEWLDVNYGRLVRELFLGSLGGKNIHVVEPTAMPFPDAATTAAITGFEVGARPVTIGMRRVPSLKRLGTLRTDRHVGRERLEAAARWTPLTRPAVETREGYVELGELCRVHRGQVTGANRVWIAGADAEYLPTSVLFRTVTKARELFAADGTLTDATPFRRVIDLPVDLDQFDSEQRQAIEKFLKHALSLGADQGFVARNRKAWWSVGLRVPAPILATYMARRPPAFVRNMADVRHINIAHGLYPRDPLSETVLRALADFLSCRVSTDQGRMYSGGLTKFEPREMERLLVPCPDLLNGCLFPEVLI